MNNIEKIAEFTRQAADATADLIVFLENLKTQRLHESMISAEARGKLGSVNILLWDAYDMLKANLTNETKRAAASTTSTIKLGN